MRRPPYFPYKGRYEERSPVSVSINLHGLLRALREELRFRPKPFCIVISSVRDDGDDVYTVQVADSHRKFVDEEWENYQALGPVIGGHPAWIGTVLRVDSQAGKVVVALETRDHSPADFSELFLEQPDFQAIVRNWVEDRIGGGDGDLPSLYTALADGEYKLEPQTAELAKFADVDPLLRDAQRLALRNASRPISIIWGPPGTGKTITLGACAAAYSLAGLRVLALAPSNLATDQIALAIDEARKRLGKPLKAGELVRPGSPIDPELRKRRHLMTWSDELHRQNAAVEKIHADLAERQRRLEALKRGALRRELTVEVAEIEKDLRAAKDARRRKVWSMGCNARILVATITSAYHHLAAFMSGKDGVGALLFDEASMVPRYAPIPFLSENPRHVVISGDWRQLAPVRRSKDKYDENSKYWIGDNLFKLSGVRNHKDVERLEREGVLSLLDEQSRMTPTLCETISRVYYLDRLKTIDPPTPPPIVPGWPRDPIIVVDPVRTALPKTVPPNVSEVKDPKEMRYERSAWIALLITKQAVMAGGRNRVLLITPFREQTRLLRELVRAHLSRFMDRIRVGTVHTAQGQEADLVIFDPVDPEHFWLRGGFGAEAIEQLLCVAFSRARRQIVVICERERSQQNRFLKPLLEKAEEWAPEMDGKASVARRAVSPG